MARHPLPLEKSSRNPVVDLANLRLFTDGDLKRDREFISLFCLQVDEGIGRLNSSCADMAGEVWVEAAHSLKGAAANLGAEPLRLLCEKAQNRPKASPHEKKKLLMQIEDELRLVKGFLRAEGLMPENHS